MNKLHSKSFTGCYSRDNVKIVDKYPQSGIVNLQNSSLGGTHWVAYYIPNSKKISYYFDSYGVVPDDSLISKLRPRKIVYNTTPIQGYNDTYCGYICMDFILTQEYNTPFLEAMDLLRKKYSKISV